MYYNKLYLQDNAAFDKTCDIINDDDTCEIILPNINQNIKSTLSKVFMINNYNSSINHNLV